MKQNNKHIAVICPNGMVKFFNPDGTRCKDHPMGYARDIEYLKANFIVKYK